MRLTIESINKSISQLNETIDGLLGEQVIATPLDDGGVPLIKQKFTVYEDDAIPVNTETEFFIGVTDAKEYKSDVQVGDEIEIEVLDFDNSGGSDWSDFFSQDTVTSDDLKQIILGGGKTVRIGGSVIKYGPKTYKKLKISAGAIRDWKKYVDRYGEKVEHSLCYCLHFTNDYLDSNGDTNKQAYEDEIHSYIKPVQDEMLTTWDYCHAKFNKNIEKKDDRQDTTSSCLTLDVFWEQQHTLMDDLLSKLSKFFEVRGVTVKKNKKNDIKNDTSVAQRIVSRDKMQIEFDAPVMWKNPAGGNETLYSANQNVNFKIDGTYSDTSNSVRLKHGTKLYVLTFTKSAIGQRQSNNAFWVVNPDGSINTSKTTWSGKIIYYTDN
tara:strand:+ start:2001 stop:3137 length:1137 start_codon:yes stop_codon:yes gene_type:complete